MGHNVTYSLYGHKAGQGLMLLRVLYNPHQPCHFQQVCEHYRRHQGISRRIVQGAKGMSRSIYLRHLKDQISTGLVFIRVDHDSLEISP